MQVTFLTLAQQEVDEAVQWFGQSDADLSQSFLNDLAQAVNLIKKFPYASFQVVPEVRRCLFAHYPYALIYSVVEETILVLALAHTSRKPDYWVDRLK